MFYYTEEDECDLDTLTALLEDNSNDSWHGDDDADAINKKVDKNKDISECPNTNEGKKLYLRLIEKIILVLKNKNCVLSVKYTKM